MQIMFRKAVTIVFAVAMMLGGSGLWIVGGSPAYASSGPSWGSVGPSPLTDYKTTAMAMDVDNGTPYVAFPDQGVTDNNKNKIIVMKYDANNVWSVVGSPHFSDDQVISVNLAVYDGTPYVAYTEGKKIIVQYYNGEIWTKLPDAANLSSTNSAVSMAVYGNTVYVAYDDPSRNLALEVKKYTNNQWEFVGQDQFTFQSAADFTLAINSSGTPYVATRNANASTVAVESFNGSNWEAVGNLDTVVGATSNFSMAFDQNDTPYVAYRALASSKGTLLKYSGGSWSTVGTPPFSQNYIQYLSLSVDGTTPYVAYTDYSTTAPYLSLAKYDGQNWSFVGSQSITPIQSNTNTMVTISGGIPYVFYIQNDNVFKPTVLKYAIAPTSANKDNNTVSASPSTVIAGSPIALTASGDRQLAVGEVVYDERYIPISWTSDEPDKSGNFDFDGTNYTAAYTPEAGGTYTVTATFQKMKWDGNAWVNAGTDTKTTSVTVKTYTIAPLSDQSLEPLERGYTSGSQETRTIDITNTGTENVTNLTATLSNGDASSFIITQPLTATLDSGAPGTSFTIKAKDGLPGGTYTATVKVSADTMDDVEFTVTQVVNNPPKGDVNGDGHLTPADALYVTKYVNSTIQLTDKELYILDMNDDGFVNAEDAKIIMQIYVGGNAG